VRSPTSSKSSTKYTPTSPNWRRGSRSDNSVIFVNQCYSITSVKRREVEGSGCHIGQHYVQTRIPVHLVLGVTLIFLQQLLLGKRHVGRNAQLVFQIFFEEHGFSCLLFLLLFVLVDGILVEIVFGVEVRPDRKCKDDCFFDPIEEAVPEIAMFDVGV